MLQDYQKKRDFKQTPEPHPAQKTRNADSLIFVIQKHAARQLHYDFRLEVDGVLKSWAVAKGPSSDTATKRLAVMVEDHPLEYADFEGVIPAGQYGAGQVIVWDRGIYSPDEDGELHFGDRTVAEDMMTKGLTAGKISITLRGEKLKGSWTLVKMQRSDNNWLLIKHRDEYADATRDILSVEASVISGLTINDLKSGRLPEPPDPAPVAPADIAGAIKAAFPSKISPMLASPVSRPFSDEKWLFEPKLDGFRTLAFLNNGKVRLQSRNEFDVTVHYKALAESVKRQPAKQLILDGEIIALDAKGKLCFQCLQGLLKSMKRPEKFEAPSAVIYYVFDILYLDGFSLTKVPLIRRKELLKSMISPTDDLRLVEHFATDGPTVYQAAIKNGMEGVVAKGIDSIYEPGKRSRNWLKIKAAASDDFVVAGYTPGTGNRTKTFGALVLGYYDNEQELQPAGNVGSGFDNDTLADLRKRLDFLIAKSAPFKTKPEDSKDVTWVKPEIVVEVKFAEWTRDGRLRAPVFLRVRDDKPANAVHPLKAVDPPGEPADNPPDGKGEAAQDILAQLSGGKNTLILAVESQKVPLSNLDKELWPEYSGHKALTKRDLLSYLVKTAPYLLPHLKDRPLSLNRYPGGIYGQHFFQKHYQPVPQFVETAQLSSHDTPEQEYLLCNNLATLLWLGQIADIELHTWFSRVKSGTDFRGTGGKNSGTDFFANYPDFLIFDIDPYIYSGKEASGAEPELNRAAFSRTCEAASKLKEILDNLGCPAFVKTSGKTGLHVFVPILRQLEFHETHAAAETLSRFLLQKYPDLITVDWAVEKRAGKIFMDYNQNVRGKTLASIYSPRPVPQASVSVPLRWDELGKVYPTDFTILNVPSRLAAIGDLWNNIDQSKIDLVKQIAGVKL